MGKRNSRRKNAASNDDLSDDKSNLEIASDSEYEIHKPSLLDVEALCEKRRSTREDGLLSLIDAFRHEVHYDFAEKNFVNLLYGYRNSLKHGAPKEISLAAQALALLALTIGYGDDASELLKDSFAPISRALNTHSEESRAKVLQCLAIVTFIGANDQGEIERAMQMIWQFIPQKPRSNVAASPIVTVSAIYAWSFVLTTATEWSLVDSQSWQELTSHFSSLLEVEDRSVRIAAGQALAILFEIEDSENFISNAIETLKQKIIDQVEALSTESGGRGSSKKNLFNQRVYFKSVYEFMKKRYCPKSSRKYGRKLLTLSTWSALVQLNFLGSVIGPGFFKHIQENNFFHDVFEMTSEKKEVLDRKLTHTEKKNNFFHDAFEMTSEKKEVLDRKLTHTEKRMYKSPNSIANKARSRELRKERSLYQRNMGNGHFRVMESDD